MVKRTVTTTHTHTHAHTRYSFEPKPLPCAAPTATALPRRHPRQITDGGATEEASSLPEPDSISDQRIAKEMIMLATECRQLRARLESSAEEEGQIRSQLDRMRDLLDTAASSRALAVWPPAHISHVVVVESPQPRAVWCSLCVQCRVRDLEA